MEERAKPVSYFWERNLSSTIQHFLLNGGRREIIGYLVAVVALATLLANVLFGFAQPSAPYEPLSYVVPQQVIASRLRAGEALEVNAITCNKASQDLAVQGSSYFRNINTGALLPYLVNVTAIVAPGCVERHFSDPIPASLAPGTYRLEGTVTVLSGERRQYAGWHTEDFVVVP